MPLDSLSLTSQIALGGEALLLLLGCYVLWRLVLCRAGREAMRQPSPIPPAPWTPIEFGLATVAVIGGGVAGQIAAQLVARQLDPAPDLEMFLLGVGFQGGLLLGAAIARTSAISPLPRPLDEMPSARAETPPALPAEPPAPDPVVPPLSSTSPWIAGPLAILAGLPVLMAVNIGWTTLLERLGWDTAKQPLVDVFSETQSPVVLVGMTVLAVIVAPIVEETIFRAGLFRFLRTRVPRPVALVLPAVLFGSLHQNLVAFVPLVVLGLIFALSYERTGRIAVPIIAHALFNLNTVVLLLAGVNV